MQVEQLETINPENSNSGNLNSGNFKSTAMSRYFPSHGGGVSTLNDLIERVSIDLRNAIERLSGYARMNPKQRQKYNSYDHEFAAYMWYLFMDAAVLYKNMRNSFKINQTDNIKQSGMDDAFKQIYKYMYEFVWEWDYLVDYGGKAPREWVEHKWGYNELYMGIKDDEPSDPIVSIKHILKNLNNLEKVWDRALTKYAENADDDAAEAIEAVEAYEGRMPQNLIRVLPLNRAKLPEIFLYLEDDKGGLVDNAKDIIAWKNEIYNDLNTAWRWAVAYRDVVPRYMLNGAQRDEVWGDVHSVMNALSLRMRRHVGYLRELPYELRIYDEAGENVNWDDLSDQVPLEDENGLIEGLTPEEWWKKKGKEERKKGNKPLDSLDIEDMVTDPKPWEREFDTGRNREYYVIQIGWWVADIVSPVDKCASDLMAIVKSAMRPDGLAFNADDFGAMIDAVRECVKTLRDIEKRIPEDFKSTFK